MSIRDASWPIEVIMMVVLLPVSPNGPLFPRVLQMLYRLFLRLKEGVKIRFKCTILACNKDNMTRMTKLHKGVRRPFATYGHARRLSSRKLRNVIEMLPM